MGGYHDDILGHASYLATPKSESTEASICKLVITESSVANLSPGHKVTQALGIPDIVEALGLNCAFSNLLVHATGVTQTGLNNPSIFTVHAL